jgi:hypothetical protein
VHLYTAAREHVQGPGALIRMPIPIIFRSPPVKGGEHGGHTLRGRYTGRGLRSWAFCCVLALLGLNGQVYGAATEQGAAPADFAVQVPLGLTGDGPWYRLELPLALQLSARRADTQDLRIFDASSAPQAFAVFHDAPTPPALRHEHAVHAFALFDALDANGSVPKVKVHLGPAGEIIGVTPASQLEAIPHVRRGWLIDTSAVQGPLTGLNLHWRGDDGFQRFSIEASDDLQHWHPWGEGQVARLSLANERVEQREVTLPGHAGRYLRLLWQTPRLAPLLDTVQVISSQARELAPMLNWSAPLTASLVQPGEYVWRLPTRLAVEALKLDVLARDSLAVVSVSGRAEANEPWKRLASGLIYRLSQGGSESVEDELTLTGEPIREVRIVVDGRGASLGSAPTLRVAVAPSQVVFLARGTAPFTLAIGNAAVQATGLPLSLLMAGDPQPLKAMDIARLAGTPMIDSGDQLLPAPATDWKRVAWLSALLMALAALALLARGWAKARQA